MDKRTAFQETLTKLSPEKRLLLEKRLSGALRAPISRGTIPRRPENGPARLSFFQVGLWFLDQLEPGNPFYNIPATVHIRGSLRIPIVQKCLNEIVRRHEVLRTTFSTGDGEPVLIVHPPAPVRLPVVDLHLMETEARSEEVQRLSTEQTRQPFDLSTGPLVRTVLLRLGETEHVLLVTIHHIIFDGWSLRILLKEIATLYEAYAADEASPLPELMVQYADYAEWQRTQLTEEKLESQLNYWRQQLAGMSPGLDLPTDRVRPPVLSFRGRMEYFRIYQDLVKRLTALSQQTQTTLFMTMLAGFVVLLSRYSRQDDINIGSPISSRDYPELEPLIGYFINTVVLRFRLHEGLTFAELLEQTRHVTLDVHAHRDVPFERVVKAVQPKRSLSQTPLFQAMFILENFSKDGPRQQTISLSPILIQSLNSPFDITVSLEEQPSGMKGIFEYSTDLFQVSTVRRMIEHYRLILEGMAENPHQCISQLSLLTETEHHRVLSEWNTTAAAFPCDRCLHELFGEQVEKTPHAVAAVCGDERVTYRELNDRAHSLACVLQGKGVGPDRVVAICAERSIQFLTAILGILKAGGAYLPISTDYPRERIDRILYESRASIVLASRDRADVVRGRGEKQGADQLPEIVILEELSQQELQHGPLLRDVTPGNLAYIIYTSGSTGAPKGAMIEHRGMLNHLYVKISYLGLTDSDIVAQTASQVFDISVWQFLAVLLVGGCVRILDDTITHDPVQLLDQVAGHGVSILEVVPSMLRMMLEELEYRGPARPPLRSMRWLLLTGEALPSALCRRWFDCYPAIPIVNAYGPTECSDDITHHSISKPPADDAIMIPIGRPVANMHLYVLDADLQPVPIGMTGQLYAGGAGVGRGYVNSPERTADVFVPDPFSDVPGARMYKTGDVVRWQPDGTLEFFGRVDHQVKIRGFRIELGEIEAILSKHPNVREALVMVREDQPGNQRLAAYIVLHAQVPDAPGDLSVYLRQKLPGYMIPSTFVILETMPLTPNGKVDHRALPIPDATAGIPQTEYVPPRTATERILTEMCAELLGRERVGIYDNFFDLGGHSLLATQFISRVRKAFEMEVPLKKLFESPTVAGLSEYIETAPRERGLQPAPTIHRIPREGPIPLSFAQQRLWFLDQLEGESAAYNMPFALRLRGPIRLDVMKQAVQEIVRRHEVLRTVFCVVNDVPVQHIIPDMTLPVPVVDLYDISAQARSVEVDRLAREEALRPFVLAEGPLFRVTVLKTDVQEHVVLLTIHHIISDGWSVGLFIRELIILYAAFSSRQASPLPELPIQYADYAEWQRQWLSGERRQLQLDFWKLQLGGAPRFLELPTDRPRPPIQSFRGATAYFECDPSVTQSLRTLTRQSESTLFMTLLSAFALLLSRYSRQDDIVIGSPIANRNYYEIENLIGFFVNTLALRIDLSGNPTFRELLDRVRRMTFDAHAHQELPFEHLVEELQPERTMSYNPLFQVVFVLQNAPAESRTISGLIVEPVAMANSRTKFDLTLSMEEAGQTLKGSIEYNTDIFDAATITSTIGNFKTLLAAIVADPNRRILDLPIITERERRQLLIDWNETHTDYPRDTCIHQIFEEQATMTPNVVALVFGDEQLTYHELNRRANQVAHYLQTLGVGPEALVGINVERSLEMIIGLLGILKSGGAYLPLDASYPKERLAFMLEDACVAVIITLDRLVKDLPAHHAQIVCLDSGWESIARFSSENLVNDGTAHSLAYVMYTSGSTGRPKGVAVEHQAVVRLIKQTNYVTLTCGEIMLQFAPSAFDASTFEIWGSLLNGARLVVMSPGLPSLEELGAALKRHRISTLWLTAPLFHQMVEYQGEHLKGIRQLLAGGDVLSVPHVRKAFQMLPNCRLINGYGPTEGTTFTCCHSISGASEEAVSIPIGRTIANTQVYILDQNLNPVPIGVPGELYIGGDGLARCYLNRPALTAEKFIPHPYSDRAGARLYKTGDLARWLPTGNVQYLGRIDLQVKLRGFRIELGEIETVLAQHPAVRESVVVVREDTPGDKRLIAYAVTIPEQEPPVDEVKAFLKEKLPDYMIPGSFVFLATMPLTPNGKVDRSALPAPAELSGDLKPSYVAPGNPTEELLSTVCAGLLGLERVGVYDNFFELGGHSLLATQFISRVRETLGVELPLRVLFEFPTIAGISEYISANRNMSRESVPLVAPVSRDGVLPLSLAQQKMLYVDELWGANSTYNIPYALRFTGSLDRTALARSMQEIVRRHEVLRTVFPRDAGGRVQNITPFQPLPLAVVDIETLSAEDQAIELERIAVEEAKRPFDLTVDLPVRTALLRLNDIEHVLLVVVHHIAFDAWSERVFAYELSTLYGSFMRTPSSSMPELPLQYADYASWESQEVRRAMLGTNKDFWSNFLKEIPPVLELPLDRERPPLKSYRALTKRFDFDFDLAGKLRMLSRRSGTTLYAVLCAGFATVLYGYSGQEHIVMSSPLAKRNRKELESLIGFFVSNIVLNIPLSEDLIFLELLNRVRQVMIDASVKQDIPYERALMDLDVDWYVHYPSLMQVLFNVVNTATATIDLPHVTVTPMTIEGFAERSHLILHDLDLEIRDMDRELSCYLRYSADLFDASTIDRIIRRFTIVLNAVIDNPDRRLSELCGLMGRGTHENSP